MKKNGFTLIELLAVIVILAIIALIAAPIVFNIIEDTKNSATLRSAEFYLDAVEIAIPRYIVKGGIIESGIYKILENGNLCLKEDTEADEDELCDEELLVDITGEKPNVESTVEIENGKIKDVVLNYNDKIIIKDNLGNLEYQIVACEVKSGDGSNIGDIIDCVGEEFYVIDSDEETITMLAKYNLDVGLEASYIEGYEEYGYIGFKEIENPTGIQSEKAIGGIKYYYEDENLGYICITENSYGYAPLDHYFYDRIDQYELDEETNTRYVYDSNSYLYSYVENYEKYLKERGVSSADASLISYKQLLALGCSESSCSSAPEWVYSVPYSTGSIDILDWVIQVTYDERGPFVTTDSDPYLHEPGLRPVIKISASEI